uniref:Putative secreted protein n=1 Tax=Anopheles darlingi TaxID=43151 RepID=A0A2M4DA84_ANODA
MARAAMIRSTIGLSSAILLTATLTICSANGCPSTSQSAYRLNSHRQRPSRYGDAWLSINILINARYWPILNPPAGPLSTISPLNEPTASMDDSCIFHQCGLPAFRSTSATALCLLRASAKHGSSCLPYSCSTISRTSWAVARIVNSTPCSSSSSTNFSASSIHS